MATIRTPADTSVQPRREKRVRQRQKTERIETRATAEQRKLIQEAAVLSGTSVTEFVLRSAESAAERVVREHRVIQLSQRDTVAFLQAIANPRPFDEKMREAAGWHRDDVEVKW